MRSLLRLVLFFQFFSCGLYAQENLCKDEDQNKSLVQNSNSILEKIIKSPDTIFPNLNEAIDAQVKFKKPHKFIATEDKNFPKFPSYSKCKKSFFRVATVGKDIDQKISEEGWKSGWVRKADQLKKNGQEYNPSDFSALPLSEPFENRIIEYVRVKDKPSEFPKDSSVVGVLENPIRTLSVGYHTGYNNGIKGDHMRMDEIEVGPCAQAPECQKISAVDTEAVFKKRNLIPRYSVEGEWAIEKQIPTSCVVSTYRIKFGKVDQKCYSDGHNNCDFK